MKTSPTIKISSGSEQPTERSCTGVRLAEQASPARVHRHPHVRVRRQRICPCGHQQEDCDPERQEVTTSFERRREGKGRRYLPKREGREQQQGCARSLMCDWRCLFGSTVLTTNEESIFHENVHKASLHTDGTPPPLSPPFPAPNFTLSH
eukprot:768281-Hanusia_phi.AAC.12